MSKITAEHLARKAYVYIRQSRPYHIRSSTMLRASVDNMDWLIAAGNLAGPRLRLSMKTRGTPARVRCALVLSSCWPMFARARWGRSFVLKVHDWHAMVGSGIPCSNFVVWSTLY